MSIQRRRLSSIRLILLGIYAAILFLPGIARSQSCSEWYASVELITGSPQVQNAGDTLWRPVKLHDVYCKGDKLKVDKGSEVQLKVLDTNIAISDTHGRVWTLNAEDVNKLPRRVEETNGTTIDVGSLTAIIFVGLVILLAFFNIYRHIPQKYHRLIEYLGNVDVSRKR